MDREAIKIKLSETFPVTAATAEGTLFTQGPNGLLERAHTDASINKANFCANMTRELLFELFGDGLIARFPEFAENSSMEDFWNLLRAHSDSTITVDEFVCDCFGEVYIDPLDAKEIYDVYRDQNEYMPTTAIGDAIRALGFNPTEAEAQDIANKCDINADGVIEPHEWELVLKDLKIKQDVQSDAKLNFDIVAKATDSIPTTELMFVAKNLGIRMNEDELKRMLDVVDENRDGAVQYEEFLPMLHKIQGP